MTSTSPPAARNGRPERGPVRSDVRHDTGGRIGTLRGAAVQIDARRIGVVVTGLVLATLALLVVAFALAGAHKNAQINELHQRGVPVTVTVTGCLGLLGGSGSNAAGYSCHGTFTLDGHRYTEPLPGTSFHRPESTIPSIAVPGDPALVAPVTIVQSEQASASVYILPAALAFVLLALVGVILWRRHAARARST